jgi:hypothetical protein
VSKGELQRTARHDQPLPAVRRLHRLLRPAHSTQHIYVLSHSTQRGPGESAGRAQGDGEAHRHTQRGKVGGSDIQREVPPDYLHMNTPAHPHTDKPTDAETARRYRRGGEAYDEAEGEADGGEADGEKDGEADGGEADGEAEGEAEASRAVSAGRTTISTMSRTAAMPRIIPL